MSTKRAEHRRGWRPTLAAALLLFLLPGFCVELAAEEMRLCFSPALSPDGKLLAVEWNGDLWLGDSTGGVMRRLTATPSVDAKPVFSPDGKLLAFQSSRSGIQQVYVMRLDGGQPRQVTFHSEGSRVEDWAPDGKSLLTIGLRDHFWTHANRLLVVPAAGERISERLVFNGHAASGRYAGSAEKILFTRFGESWWRQGYRGGRASQAWVYDATDGSFDRLGDAAGGVRAPLWHEATKSVLYLSNADGVYNLWRRGSDGEVAKLTSYESGLVSSLCVASSADVVVFRHKFDLYRLDLSEPDSEPTRLTLNYLDDLAKPQSERLVIERATEVDFNSDGSVVAMIADRDLWVMATASREPRQVTATSLPESSPRFDPDGERLAFISESDGRADIWITKRSDPDKDWAEETHFEKRRLTDDDATPLTLRWSPSGDRIAYATAQGELIVRGLEGGNATVLHRGWDVADIGWSPDGGWLCFVASDSNFNSDVFVVRANGQSPPTNVSCHPDDDYEPSWSPDGARLAFVGKREGDESDLFVVNVQSLTAKSPDAPAKDDSLAANALRSANSDENSHRVGDSLRRVRHPAEPFSAPHNASCSSCFEGKVVRLSNPEVRESNPLWSPDSKSIVFTGRSSHQRGGYKVKADAESDAEPTRWTKQTGEFVKWSCDGDVLLWRTNSLPAKLDANGDLTKFSFKAYQAKDVGEHHKAIVDHCWRILRDKFYDPKMHGQDWDAVRREYLPMADYALDPQMVEQLVNAMIGELQASHLGFKMHGHEPKPEWTPTTRHPGVWFRSEADLTVTETAPEAEESGVALGDRFTHVNGEPVGTRSELAQALTGAPDSQFNARLVDSRGEARSIKITPIRYSDARRRLYDSWVKRQKQAVATMSDGRLGYIHLRDMETENIPRFERELFAAGHGREGLVIDVRYNTGGRIADHLLSMLCHPRHAITSRRGQGNGYPQGRRFYTAWNSPIILLVNGASYSNAEIFSRAIQTTGRGQLVGEATAGGVLSQQFHDVMGVGRLRIAFRGWREADSGETMEGAGVIPDHPVEAAPADLPSGRDPQLEVAIDRLLASLDGE